MAHCLWYTGRILATSIRDKEEEKGTKYTGKGEDREAQKAMAKRRDGSKTR